MRRAASAKQRRAASRARMKSARVLLVAVALLALAGCGRVADLKPAPGQPLPVKPLMARTTPTPSELLTPPTYARPERVDELVKRSQPRAADPFDLPPPTAARRRRCPPAADPQPVDQRRPARRLQETERMPNRVRKAVFPVAGLGTRLLPATKSIPKEMMTIVDRPLIQYAVDEAREAGIEQMIFVTGRGKSALVDYFDRPSSSRRRCASKGKSLDVARTVERAASARSSPSASSSRSASAMRSGARAHIVGDEPFAVLLPDDLMVGTARLPGADGRGL